MSDIKNSSCQAKIGSGQQMSSTVIGTKHVMAIHKDGTRQELKLVDCRYVPELWVNLFSVNKALTNGFKLSNNGLVIKLTKKNAQIQFDRVFETGTSAQCTGKTDRFCNFRPIFCSNETTVGCTRGTARVRKFYESSG